MKKLLLALVVAIVAVPGATAGGWATVGLSSLPPSGLEPNQSWPVEITVLQHGQTPLAGVTPIVRVRDGGGKVVRNFPAKPTGKIGVYRANVTFPGKGTYSYEVYDGFGTYGGARTHTFRPIAIGAGGDGLPFGPIALAVAVAAGLATATVLILRRRRPEPQPVHLSEAA